MLFDPVILPWLIVGGTVPVMLFLLLSGRKSRADERVAELSSAGGSSGAAAQIPGGAQNQSSLQLQIERRFKEEERKNNFRDRLVQAGFYGRGSASAFVMLRVISVAAPAGLGFTLFATGLMPLTHGLLVGLIIGLAGILAPTFWLDYVKTSRQKQVRRALPDALDVISVCLEGGMSLPAALSRVARELATAHPMLALELAIVERETRMGRTTGEAMRSFAKRFDLEELRSLALVIVQAERYGSSVTHAMEVYSDTLRLKRHQRAEEMAQKAVVKIIFPTLLCIFPGIFIVVLGPAAINIYKVFGSGALNLN